MTWKDIKEMIGEKVKDEDEVSLIDIDGHTHGNLEFVWDDEMWEVRTIF